MKQTWGKGGRIKLGENKKCGDRRRKYLKISKIFKNISYLKRHSKNSKEFLKIITTKVGKKATE